MCCVPTIHVLSKNKQKYQKRILLKIFSFYNLGKICILHGHVFIMNIDFYWYLLPLKQVTVLQHKKTCLPVDSDQVRHKLDCTITKDSKRLEISD